MDQACDLPLLGSATVAASERRFGRQAAAITAFTFHGGLGAEPPESQGVWGAQPPRIQGVRGAKPPAMQGVRGAQPPGMRGVQEGGSPPA